MSDITVVEVTQGWTVDVTDNTGRTVTVDATPTYALQVATPGIQGAAGPQGPIGPAGGAVFVYDRNGVPASTWIIAHNLNRLVHVTVVLDSGEEITADVAQGSPNTCTITFAQPTSGKALVG
ncbi:hypothetical protein GCM10023196_035740 [Actinoallomurus vinaceus]|uniref:Uncharacterized protein n=1 Tax=Actinoallomurus vinaceus TaxID=1080074 RepID=A0ABP8UAP5_9ACTN